MRLSLQNMGSALRTCETASFPACFRGSEPWGGMEKCGQSAIVPVILLLLWSFSISCFGSVLGQAGPCACYSWRPQLMRLRSAKPCLLIEFVHPTTDPFTFLRYIFLPYWLQPGISQAYRTCEARREELACMAHCELQPRPPHPAEDAFLSGLHLRSRARQVYFCLRLRSVSNSN